MKTAASILLLIVVPLAFAGVEVKPGDALPQVRAALGTPRGTAEADGRLLLYYDRGEVELRDGVVTRVSLLTPAEHAEAVTRREAEAARIRDEREIRTARLNEEGRALKAAKLADAAFRLASPAVQTAFWEDFSRRYPEVPCAVELADARQRLAAQLAAERAWQEQQTRLAELEARLAEAENRAAEALARSEQRTYAYSPFVRYPRQHRPFALWPVDYRAVDLTTPWATSADTPWATPLPGPLPDDYRLAPATQRMEAERRREEGRSRKNSDGNHPRGGLRFEPRSRR